MKFIEGSAGYGKQEVELEKPLPVGVSRQMHSFLLDVKETGAYHSLDQRRKTLIDIYYSNDVSTSELRTTAGVTSRQGVNQLIISGMETLWNNTPDDIKAKYVKGEVISLKDRTSMVAAKLSEATKGRPSPMKGRSHSPEARAKMSEATKGRPGHSQSPETRAKISESQRRRHQERRSQVNPEETEHVIFDAKDSESLN